MTNVKDDVQPSAIPSDDEIKRWAALPRDEQLERLRRAMSEAEASGLSDRSMEDIKAAALKRIAEQRNG